MIIVITRINLENEMDIVLAYRRAMQIGRFTGINISEQTRFATAVSEICRNALEFCKAGDIVFQLDQKADNEYLLEGIVSDCGEGIENLPDILARNPQTHTGKGRGIVFSRKLVDYFRINSTKKGTIVELRMNVPSNGRPINKLIIQGWIQQIAKEPNVSAYEELKARNIALMQITDELKAEQLNNQKQIKEIQQLNEKLNHTNTYLEEFTYTVSHDLKTPLTTLKLALGFLEETEDPEVKISYIRLIERAAKRLEKTVGGLVDILDLQTQPLDYIQRVNLPEVFNDTVEELGTIVQDKAIQFEQDLKVADVHYFAPYIDSIFRNLIGNSVKYRRVGVPLKVSVSSRRKGGLVEIKFEDNAEGIDMEKKLQQVVYSLYSL